MTDIPSREPLPMELPIDGVLSGFLVQPQRPWGLVLFAHGGGSNRFSRRNRAVAEILDRARVATLLFDLLTAEEQEIDAQSRELSFDIPLLTGRLIRAIDWVSTQEHTAGLALGLFGSGTGAAAALGAAAERQREVRALVCRGGRVDLAVGALSQVFAPTLLIVGGLDLEILNLGRAAAKKIPAQPRLEIIPGATHLFEEAGKLDAVGFLSRDWFLRHFEAEPSVPDGAQW